MPVWVLWSLWGTVVLLSATLRTSMYAAFSAVVLGLVTLSWSALDSSWRALLPAHAFLGDALCWPVAVLQIATWLHFLSLIRPRLRPWAFRLLVTWPGLWMVAGSWLALPWALATVFGLPPWGWWLPFVAASYGLWESLTCALESVPIPMTALPAVDPSTGGSPQRVPVAPRAGLGVSSGTEGALRVAHLTDPHLGALVSARRLRNACRRIVEARPDLVAITGDFLTMESQREAERLTWALEPLGALTSAGTPVVACLGNHDLEAPATVESACSAAGIRLLVDEGIVLSLGARSSSRARRNIGVVGLDYRFAESTQELLERIGAEVDRAVQDVELLIVLAHAPSSFRSLLPILERLPADAPTVTLSGHLHGGQLGLLRFGIDWTVLRLARRPMFEHGLWRAGRHHLYSSRGFGHYGFPFRIGVPAELSTLELDCDGSSPGSRGIGPEAAAST